MCVYRAEEGAAHHVVHESNRRAQTHACEARDVVNGARDGSKEMVSDEADQASRHVCDESSEKAHVPHGIVASVWECVPKQICYGERNGSNIRKGEHIVQV